MKETSNKVLTLSLLEEIGAYVYSTKGTRLISRFCNAVENGQTPLQKDLELLAFAFKPLKDLQYNLNEKRTKTDNVLRDALAEFANTLNFKTSIAKYGMKEAQKLARIVVEYGNKYDELIKNGKSLPHAKKEARAFICSTKSICDRTLRNYIKKYTDMADFIQAEE